MMPLVDAWRLEHARQERDEAQARALKYEQALREIAKQNGHYFVKDCDCLTCKTTLIVRAALDKPGTEVENSANEAENQKPLGFNYQLGKWD